MDKFLTACETAKTYFVKAGYKAGFDAIGDIGDRWIFVSHIFDSGEPEYGNCPVTVDKTTGKCESFSIFSPPENMEIFENAKPVALPPQYVIKD